MIEVSIKFPDSARDPNRQARLEEIGEMIAESLDGLTCRKHGLHVRRLTIESKSDRTGVALIMTACCDAMRRAAYEVVRGQRRP